MDFGTWFVLLAPFVLIISGYYLIYSGRDQRSGAVAVFSGIGLYVVAASARWGLWGLFGSLGILAFILGCGYLLERFDRATKSPQ